VPGVALGQKAQEARQRRMLRSRSLQREGGNSRRDVQLKISSRR